jgi:ribosomal protein S9
MANKEYHYAIGRRKETSAVVKLFGKGTGNFVVKTTKGIEKSLQQYFGGNDYLYQNAIAPFATLGADTLKKFDAQIKIVG